MKENNQSLTSKDLEITDAKFRDFNLGVMVGIAKAHYDHTTHGRIGVQEFALQNLERLFEPSPNSLLINTKYEIYRKSLFNILPKKLDQNKMINLTEFLKTIPDSDNYALGQKITELNRYVPKLEKDSSRINERSVDTYKIIYDMCCSCYEKYLKILYSVLQIFNEQSVFYDKVKKMQAYDIKKSLLNQNSKDYNILVEPFKTIIWNANKHPGTVKDPTNRTVTFYSNEGKLEYDYEENENVTKSG